MTTSTRSFPRLFSLAFPVALACAITCQAQTDVTTWHSDAARTGQNLTESILTPQLVNSTNFGLLGTFKVDGKVDAQPLYVSALNLPGVAGTHNVLFIATEHDSVYAVDADTGKQYWHRTMLPAGETTSDSRNCNQVVPEIGITATPAIDRTVGPHGTIYVVAMSKDSSGNYYHRIHALDITTGAEEFNGPVQVHATYPGSGDGSTGGTVTFDPKQYKERPGLLLLNGMLYTSWGSHCDVRPYGGWMMTYNQTTLQQTAAIDFVPNGSDAAPWNSGAGPAADSSGNVYTSLGNGTFDTTLNAQGLPSQGDYGNSLVKLAFQNNKLNVLDYWTMYNSNAESNVDADLGSGGYMLLPDLIDATGATRHLSVAAGKDTNLYVADRDNMGHYNPNNNSTLYQELTGALPGGVWSSPAYFNNRVYYGSVGATMRVFDITAAKLSTSPAQTTPTSFAYPGTTPSISAFGTSNAIVWAAENGNTAVLHAYDANNLAVELYNSDQAPSSRDHFGVGNKFIVPTIANGKVYVGTTNSVAGFGFIHHISAPLADGDYTMTNQFSKLVLDDNGTNVSGSVVYQLNPSSSLNQKWFFSYNGNGYYIIQNVSSGLFLTEPNSSATPGTLLEQATPNNQDSQLWSLTRSGTGYTITNKLTKLVLDDSSHSTSSGQYIDLYTPNGGASQVWNLQ
ncbi:MAG TPA: RICIN domain-containing protein [Acidisarcina sp.]